jgi:hypothetical protein
MKQIYQGFCDQGSLAEGFEVADSNFRRLFHFNAFCILQISITSRLRCAGTLPAVKRVRLTVLLSMCLRSSILRSVSGTSRPCAEPVQRVIGLQPVRGRGCGGQLCLVYGSIPAPCAYSASHDRHELLTTTQVQCRWHLIAFCSVRPGQQAVAHHHHHCLSAVDPRPGGL